MICYEEDIKYALKCFVNFIKKKGGHVYRTKMEEYIPLSWIEVLKNCNKIDKIKTSKEKRLYIRTIIKNKIITEGVRETTYQKKVLARRFRMEQKKSKFLLKDILNNLSKDGKLMLNEILDIVYSHDLTMNIDHRQWNRRSTQLFRNVYIQARKNLMKDYNWTKKRIKDTYLEIQNVYTGNTK